ncbi:ensconsin-like [Salvelinus namaycush]|uniref:Ensconsin-like n=1 Tax=Salvelinus namaycush TaxID=8040 RepID=A0A8U1EW21_SALNM|nr:ensconsin-like [Salvelinus namaycush]
MAVIQEKQRETPSKKPVSQEDRKGLSTQDNQDNQKDSRAGRQGEKGNDDIKPCNSEKRRAVICVPASIKSAVISNNTTSHGNPAGPQALKVAERLRLAKERREEHEKQLVSRELGWLAREERARRLYKQQLEERKRRLQEQREKEEKRRTALERREEHKKQLGLCCGLKERYESVVKKTLEKSQRIKQRIRQGSRGRKTDNKSAPRRSPLTAWERALVSRLLTPTCSYLARSRSRSHNCQSREEEVSCHSMPATATNSHKSPRRSGTTDHHLVQADLRTDYRADYRSIIQANYQVATSPSPSRTSHRSINAAQLKAAQQEENERTARRNTQQPHIPNVPLKALPTNPLPNAGVKALPTNPQCRAAVPSPERKPVIRHTSVIRQPLSQQLELELDPVPEEDTVPVPNHTLSPGNSQASQTISPGAPVPNPTLSPGNSRPIRTPAAAWDQVQPFLHSPEPQTQREITLSTEGSADEGEHLKVKALPPGATPSPRPSAGTMDPEEASRLLAEKRREREEEEAQAREKAEQQRLERDKHFQEEEEQRQERKKRLELIMRRTRKEKPILNGNSNGNSSSPEEAQPKENTEPVKNSKGTLEEVINLGVVVGTGTKPSNLGLSDTEDIVPVVAFKERRSLRTLTGMEEIQSHQRADSSGSGVIADAARRGAGELSRAFRANPQVQQLLLVTTTR